MVRRVVERSNLGGEFAGRSPRALFGPFRRKHEGEVIAARIDEKVAFRRHEVAPQHLGGQEQHLISPAEPVAVIEGLEVVEVGPAERERLPPEEKTLHGSLEDQRAGKPRERIRLKCILELQSRHLSQKDVHREQAVIVAALRRHDERVEATPGWPACHDLGRSLQSR